MHRRPGERSHARWLWPRRAQLHSQANDLFSDEIEPHCSGPNKQSYLYIFAFEQDTLVQKEKLSLGDDLALAERRGDYLVLIDGTYMKLARGQARKPSLRIVSLAQEVPAISEQADAPFVGYAPPSVKISVQGDVLLLVSEDSKVSPGIRLRRYDLSDPSSPKLTSDCSNTAPSAVRLDSSAKVAVLGDRVFVEGYWASVANGAVTNELIELNTACEMRRQEQSVNLIDVPGANVAIEVTIAEPHTLRVPAMRADT